MILSKRAWLAAIFAVYTGVVHAQSFPSQSIRFVVPWPAGGATDAIARLIAKSLSEQLGQSVFVDNKPGAGGNIGTQEFVRSKPDGHTIIMATSSTNAANPHLYAKLGFDPVKDFAPIVFIASVPNVLVVPASSPANTAAELVSQAKANPGKLTYGSGGVGSSQHLAGAMFKSIAKIDIVHVPYKGSAPAVTDLMAGHVSLMLDTASLPHIKGGKLNALAVASKSRIPALPNVPTFDELGISGMHAAAWYGVMAPAGTPKAVLDRLNTEINKALGSSEVRSRLTDFGAAEIGGGSPEEFARFSRSEIDRYAEIVRLSGAKLE